MWVTSLAATARDAVVCMDSEGHVERVAAQAPPCGITRGEVQEATTLLLELSGHHKRGRQTKWLYCRFAGGCKGARCFCVGVSARLQRTRAKRRFDGNKCWCWRQAASGTIQTNGRATNTVDGLTYLSSLGPPESWCGCASTSEEEDDEDPLYPPREFNGVDRLFPGSYYRS